MLLVPLIDSLQGAAFARTWSQVTEVPRHVTIPSQLGARRVLERNGYGESVIIIPDTILQSAQMFGITIFPKAAAAFRSRRDHWIHRVLGIGASVVGLVFSAFEGYVLRKPAGGVVIAQKAA